MTYPIIDVGGGGAADVIEVRQVAHGFVPNDIGRPVYFNKNTVLWEFAQADSLESSQIGVISTIATADDFYVKQGGQLLELNTGNLIEGGGSFVIGDYYYLSNTTAGKVTNTVPSENVNAPIYLAYTTDDAIILPWRPISNLYVSMETQTWTDKQGEDTFCIDYTVGYLDVYLNGIRLVPTSAVGASPAGSPAGSPSGSPGSTVGEFIADDGECFTLLIPLDDATDTVVAVAWTPFILTDVYTKVQSDARFAGRIDSDMDLYVATTGNDVTGNGTLIAPWASPHRAMEILTPYRIEDGATVTVNILAGVYSFSEPVISSHPNGEKINFVGANLLGNRPDDFPIGDYSVDRNAPVVPSRGIDEFYNTAGTLGADAVSGTRDPARVSDMSNNEALIRSRYATQIEFTGGSGGFEALDGDIGLINKIAIIGDSSDTDNGTYPPLSNGSDANRASGVFASGHRVFMGNSVAVHGFGGTYSGAGLNSVNSGVISVDNNSGISPVTGGITVTGCYNGITVENYGIIESTFSAIQGCTNGVFCNTGRINVNNSSISGNKQYGVWLRSNGHMENGNGIISGNGVNGYYVEYNGSMIADRAMVSGNGDDGIVMYNGSSMRSLGLNSIGNDGNGVNILSSCSALLSSDDTFITIIDNNGGSGLVATQSSSIAAYNSNITNNDGFGVISQSGSNILVQDCNITLNTLEQAYSWWHSSLSVAGSTVTRATTTYPCCRSAFGSSLYVSAAAIPSTISGPLGVTAYITTHDQSYAYIVSSGLTAGNANHFSPLGNIAGASLGYNAVA